MVKSKRMRLIISGMIAGVLFSSGAFAEEFTDDFTSALAAENWASPGLIRGIEGEKHISQYSQSSIDERYSRNRLRTASGIGTAVTKVEALVNIIGLGHASNTDTDENGVFARIEGYFYNASVPGGSSDFTGVVWAAVFVGDRGDGMEAWWKWERSTSTDFSTSTGATGTLVGPNPETIIMNKEYRLRIEYDETKTFDFTIEDSNGSNSLTEQADGPDRVAATAIESVRLATGADFTNGGDGTAAFVRAEFDDVEVKYDSGVSTMSDDFAKDALDSSKWRDDTITVVSDASEGGLVMTVQSENPGAKKRYTAHLELVDTTQNCLYAEAVWDPDTNISNSVDNRGRVRNMGYYYNDTYDGSGYVGTEGNVFVQVRIQNKDDGTLQAAAGTFREPNGSAEDFWHEFKTVPVPGTSYPMYIEFDKLGKNINFHFNGETVTHNITTPIFDAAPGTEFKALQVRIQDNDGDEKTEGYVRANFAKVFSGAKCPTDDDDFLLLLIPAILSGVK